MKKVCNICGAKHKAHGFCVNHYQNFKTTGSPYGKTGRRRRNCVEDMMKIIESIVENENGCKIWPMGVNSAGYGHFSIKNKSYNVSRLLYMTIYPGKYERLVVRHKCDIRSCCNINHLEIGTQRENILDIRNRERNLFGGPTKVPRGEIAGRSKLTEIQVIEIRNLYPEYSMIKLAKKYQVNSSTIDAILKKRSWRHI